MSPADGGRAARREQKRRWRFPPMASAWKLIINDRVLRARHRRGLYRRLYKAVSSPSTTPTSSGARSQLARLPPASPLAGPRRASSSLADRDADNREKSSRPGRVARFERGWERKRREKNEKTSPPVGAHVRLCPSSTPDPSVARSSIGRAFPSYAAARQRPARPRPRSRAACVRVPCVPACVTTATATVSRFLGDLSRGFILPTAVKCRQAGGARATA